MKVALISHEGGGISNVSAGLGKSLARRKIETTIFTGITHSGCKREKLNDCLEIVRLPILNLPPKNLWFQFLNLKKLSEALSDYTVIHGVSPTASFGLTFFKKRFPKPFVATIHDSYRVSQRVFVNQPLSSWTLSDVGYYILEFPFFDFSVDTILSRSDYITFCSQATLKELATYKKVDYGRSSIIYNGIDFEEIESVKSSQLEETEDISVIYAGRLFWAKGIILLLEAFNRMKDVKNIRLNIFGIGPLKQQIRKFILNHGLEDKVSYLGYVPHRSLIREIKKSDILVLPSLCEAQPMIILEAMACSKPVVAFDLPFSREIISNMNNGVLAKANDVKSLSEKIELLVSDERLRRRIGRAGYDHVRKNHNWDIQVDKYLKVYENVLGCV